MKRKALFLAILFLTVSITLSYFYSNKGSNNKENTITELRKKHKNFLENSPFKETLKLSKTERRALGLPPNKYYERMWELTMNPATGFPEPFKVFETQKQRDNISAKVPGDGTAGNDWISRGPNNVGGRTRVVLFDPNDTEKDRVFAGGVSGGLWVNENITDSSSAWTLVSGVPSNMNISCITVDPNNSNIWYIGTGEKHTAGAAVGNGVYKTTDGGANWSQLTIQLAGVGDLSNSTSEFLAGIYFINDIVAWDNGTSTEIFIGVGGHVYRYSSNPRDWLGLQTAGLYRSVDNGTNWTRIESINMDYSVGNGSFTFYYMPNDFEISYNNTLWMGTIEAPGFSNDGGGRIYSSIDGSTWTEATSSPLTNSDRVELAVSSTDKDKIYALTEGTTDDGPHIFSTTDSFATVIELAKPSDADNGIPANDFTRSQDYYNLVIEVDPTNDDIVYVGGIDLFRTDQGENTDLASEWKQISKWSNNSNLNTLNCSYVHADQHAFSFRPGNNNQAVIGCDGGVFYASNLLEADTKDEIIIEVNKEYVTTQFYYGGYGQDSTNELILAGSQDNGSPFINGAVAGTNSSFDPWGGDGAYTTIDKDGEYMITSYVYSNHYFYNLPYSGNTYTDYQNNPDYAIDETDTEGDFINPGGLDHNLDILYTNGTLYDYDSYVHTYRINKFVLGTSSSTKSQLTNAFLDGSPTAFKVSPFTTSSSTLLVGTDNSKLLKLSNADGNSASIVWEEITGPLFIGSVSAIEFGETENDIFITFHNYGVTSVWYSSNGGSTWRNKEGDLPDIPVKSILQNPLARNEVIIGTDLGIWVSENFNEDTPTWTSANNGMRDIKVVDLDLRTSDNSILATSFGRGTFTGNFTNETIETFTISTDESIVYGCKPSDAVFDLNFSALGGYNTSTSFSATGEPTGSTISFSTASLSATGTFSMTVGGISNVAIGKYPLIITGTGGGKTISKDLLLIIEETDIAEPNLLSPANDLENVGNVDFNWEEVTGAISYDIEVATDTNFSNIIETATVLTNSHRLINLTNLTTYYWRVQAKNICGGVSTNSSVFNFKTADVQCNTIDKTHNPLLGVPDNDPVGVSSIINITNTKIITDVNVKVNFTYDTWVGDLTLKLKNPQGTIVELSSFNGDDGAHYTNTIFDDDASQTITQGTAPFTGSYKPEESLSAFNGISANGNWTLIAIDGGQGDEGTFDSWSIEICGYYFNDDDGDGVQDADDQCPNTIAVSDPKYINSVGCFTLPDDHFSIQTIGETCVDEDNGQIIITTQDATFGYSTTINSVDYSFTDSDTTADLPPGTYEFCISVDGRDFEQCYNISIEEGEEISGIANVDDFTNSVNIQINSGTAPFNVFVNGFEVLETSDAEFSIDVNKGDIVEVATSIACEGKLSKTVNTFDEVMAYPNPTKGAFEMTLNTSQKQVVVALHSIQGKLISLKTYDVNYGRIQLNLENNSAGFYIAKMNLDGNDVSVKILKE